MRPRMHHAERLHSSAHLYVVVGVCPRTCTLRQAEDTPLVAQRDGFEPSVTRTYHIVLILSTILCPQMGCSLQKVLNCYTLVPLCFASLTIVFLCHTSTSLSTGCRSAKIICELISLLSLLHRLNGTTLSSYPR